MNTDLEDFINECSACQSQPDQCCETKQLYPVPPCPWSIILSADLFTLGQPFFNLVDYWSGFLLDTAYQKCILPITELSLHLRHSVDL